MQAGDRMNLAEHDDGAADQEEDDRKHFPIHRVDGRPLERASLAKVLALEADAV